MFWEFQAMFELSKFIWNLKIFLFSKGNFRNIQIKSYQFFVRVFAKKNLNLLQVFKRCVKIVCIQLFCNVLNFVTGFQWCRSFSGSGGQEERPDSSRQVGSEPAKSEAQCETLKCPLSH